ncbi:capping complex subunit for YIEGIA [Longirhabdus pacifica]|uniref:capping complex subunit for YIEGIA n=1 Tax=Longirhabdus pacifica TaxID=2305227 RepID=UPI0013E8C2C1|nr:hypothetical protein [Longirhabdus pacifica]
MKRIMAVVTQNKSVVNGKYIFYTNSEEELQQISFTLEKILDATAHQISDDTIMLVDHG